MKPSHLTGIKPKSHLLLELHAKSLYMKKELGVTVDSANAEVLVFS